MNPTKFLIIALIVLSAVSTIESAAVQKCLSPKCRRLAMAQKCLTEKCRRLAKKATPPKEKLVLKATPVSKDTLPPLSAKAQAAKNKAVTSKPSTPAAVLAKKTSDAKKSVSAAKDLKSKALETLKKAQDDILSSRKNIAKLKDDLTKAKNSKSKDTVKDAKIKKIAAALSKEQMTASKAKMTKLNAESAADHANISVATAKSKVPLRKGQEPTKPNPGPPKTHGPYQFYMKSFDGKRVPITKNLLDMNPRDRVDACLKIWCFSRGLKRTYR